MTPGERERYDRIDRQLEFLAAQDASLHEGIRLHSEQIARHSEQIASHSEQIARHSEQISGLADHQRELQDLVLRLGRVVEEQARAQARTDERINILIDTFLGGDRQ